MISPEAAHGERANCVYYEVAFERKRPVTEIWDQYAAQRVAHAVASPRVYCTVELHGMSFRRWRFYLLSLPEGETRQTFGDNLPLYAKWEICRVIPGIRRRKIRWKCYHGQAYLQKIKW